MAKHREGFNLCVMRAFLTLVYLYVLLDGLFLEERLE